MVIKQSIDDQIHMGLVSSKLWQVAAFSFPMPESGPSWVRMRTVRFRVILRWLHLAIRQEFRVFVYYLGWPAWPWQVVRRIAGRSGCPCSPCTRTDQIRDACCGDQVYNMRNQTWDLMDLHQWKTQGDALSNISSPERTRRYFITQAKENIFHNIGLIFNLRTNI